MMQVLGALLRYRRLVLAVSLATGALTAVYVLLSPRTYTSSASFTPQATRSQIGLGGLTAQLGLMLPGADGNQSPAFYADLLRSRTVLEPLVGIPVRFAWDGEDRRGTYIQLAEVRGTSEAQRRAVAVGQLRRAMTTTVAQRTGIVQVDATTRFPQLSAILLDSALSLLNSFNMETRRSQAAAQRQFLERRMAMVSRELQAAEGAQRAFAESNRGSLNNAPHLIIQQERLARAVSLRSQVYAGLAQALEQAKLDEIRDTPLLTVIERPSIPVQPDSRGLLLKALLGLVAGFFLGAVAALLRQAVVASRQENPESFAEFSAELAAAKSDLRRIVWPLSRQPVGNGRN